MKGVLLFTSLMLGASLEASARYVGSGSGNCDAFGGHRVDSSYCGWAGAICCYVADAAPGGAPASASGVLSADPNIGKSFLASNITGLAPSNANWTGKLRSGVGYVFSRSASGGVYYYKAISRQ